MADKREKCKGLQSSLSDALGKDLSHSEISGSRVTELDSLGDFYVAFTKELTTTINPALNQNCKEIDYTILKTSSVALGELCTKYKKLKLLASFDNCLQLSTFLEKTSIFIAGVNEWEIETELIYEVASDAIQREGDLATLGGPTVQAIVNMIKTCQEVPDRIIRAGVSVSKLKKLSVTSEDLLSSPVLNFMSNSKPLEELCDAIVEALRDAPEAHPANDLLNRKIRPSCNFIKSISRAIKIHETIISAVGTKDPLSVLGETQGSLFVTASCSLCRIRESIAKDSLIACINSFKADEMCDIFINIENELTLTCSNERARVKQLNKFTDADILEYRFAGTLIEAVVVKKYIPMLVPHWSNLVISHQLGLPPQVTGIVCTFGEVLKLSNPIEATLTLSEGIPLIIQEQASTIEAMTHAALDLAHNIAIGRVKFDVKAMMLFPTQVALRMVLFLWTELVEGSIFTTMKRSSGPHKDTSDTSSLNCLDTISGNVNQDEFIHFGTNSRKSVSLTFQSSRKTSPRKNFIDYPSPGSASSPWLRKAKKTVDSTANSHKGDNVEIERIGASDSDSSHRHRTSSVRSRATIRDSLPYQAAYTIAANLPQRAATTSAVAKQIRTPKSKDQSTFTTHARLSDILNVILSQMRQYLLSNQLSLSDTTKLRVLIMWMYRMLRTWEQDVSHAATAEDYLWLREPVCIERTAIGRSYFEQGTSSYHVKHFFLPINPKFVLTAPYLNVWSHLSTCDALSKAALIRGDALDAISTFAAISGISLDVLDARSKKLIILPKPVRNIILHAEKLSLDDQTSLCNLLKDTTDTSVSILTENIEKLHPILLSLPVPHIIIEENMQFIIECYIASSGCDDAPSLAKSISYFSKICESIGQWAIPLPLIHQAVNTLTPLMKVGLSSDAALYESIQNVILPRAPFSCISAINLAKSTLFPYRSAHIHFPRLTTCIKQTCEEMNICWSEDLDTKVMEIFKFLTGKAAHANNASVLVIRGEGVCGKTTLRDIALRAYNLLMGYSPRVSTVSPIHAEDNIRQIVDEDVDNHQSKRDRAGESSPVKLSRVILLDSLPKYKNIIRKNKNDSCFDNNAEISNREDVLFSKWLSLTGLLDLPPSMEGSVILIIETSLDTLPMDVVCCAMILLKLLIPSG